MDEQTQLYLEIKRAIYNAKSDILKKHGLTWTKFKELESMVKDNWSKIALNGYVDLGEGLIATGVEKEIRLYQGKGQVIDKELHITIHQKTK